MTRSRGSVQGVVDVLVSVGEGIGDAWVSCSRWVARDDGFVGRALDGIASGVAKVFEVLAMVASVARLRPVSSWLDRLAVWLDARATGGLLPFALFAVLFGLDAVTRAYPLDRTRENDLTLIPLPAPRPRRPDAPPVVPAPSPAPPQPALPTPVGPPDAGDEVTLRYVWKRADERSFLGIGGTTYEASAALSRGAIRARVDAFGVRQSELSYLVGEESEHALRLRQRGFVLDAERRMRVDYAQVVADNRALVRPLFDAVLARAEREGASGRRDVVAVFSGLVQDGLPYKIPEEVREGTGPDPISTGGFLVPVDALSEQPSEAEAGFGWGDCDTKSAVLASLLSHLDGMRVVMLVGMGHAFVGVSLEPESGDRYIERDGFRYVLIETTTPWPLGRIADELWYGISTLEVVQVV